MKTTVKLLTWTSNPVETMYILWENSRRKSFNVSIDVVKSKMLTCKKYKKNVEDLFLKILSNNIPIAENINFVFLLENVPIALREQIVRHRFGNKFGERLGADLIPDIHDSSWWSQTMRVLDMGYFRSGGTPQRGVAGLRITRATPRWGVPPVVSFCPCVGHWTFTYPRASSSYFSPS